MNRATIVSVAVALVSVGAAFAVRPKELPAAKFEDTGEPLFPGFSDPSIATALEVVSFDDESAKVKSFKVEQKQGRWVIPSHNDYPADGTERMGKAAASFVDVKRDVYYGDNPADHAAFGVLDPQGEEGEKGTRGRRITIKDASGASLVDVIVGKDVEGKEDFHYVRFPGEKRVYGSRIKLDISTDFTDWIEEDLLRVEREDVTAFVYDPYKVDEAQGKVVGTAPMRADKVEGEGDDWTLVGPTVVPAGKEFDAAKVRTVLGSIDRLKIVGVRPRPKPLTLPALQAVGFFVTPDGRRLFGNEGEVRLVTKQGVIYTLYFGEITYDSGLALTAGVREGEAPAPEAGEQGEGNRYMFVDVGYDPAADKGAGAGEAGAAPEGAPPAGGAGAETAKKLQGRFDEWFFVISDSSFKQIHKDRDEFFKDKPAEDKAKPKAKKAGDDGAGAPPTP